MGCGASSEAADEVVDDGEDAQCYVITTPAVLPTDDSLKQAKLHALTVEPPKGLLASRVVQCDGKFMQVDCWSTNAVRAGKRNDIFEAPDTKEDGGSVVYSWGKPIESTHTSYVQVAQPRIHARACPCSLRARIAARL